MSNLKRRQLHFETLEDVLAEAERVTTRPYCEVGNWTAGQIVYHLAEAIHKSFDGYELLAPQEQRQNVSRRREGFLRDGFPPGFKLEGDLARYTPPPEAVLEKAMERLRVAVARARDETMDKVHPFLDRMDHEQWTEFHCRHAELHLGFLCPTD